MLSRMVDGRRLSTEMIDENHFLFNITDEININIG